MLKRIDKLTPEQEAMLPIWAKKWTEIGLRTGETDWDTFDKYMPICYEKAGLEYPKKVVRVSSPLVGALAAPIAEKILNSEEVGHWVEDAVVGVVGGVVDNTICNLVRDVVSNEVGRVIEDKVIGVVEDEINNNVVDDAAGRVVRNVVGGEIGDVVNNIESAVESAVIRNFRRAINRVVVREVSNEVNNVGDAVRNEVEGAVGGVVEDAVDGAVNNAVSIVVRDAVSDVVNAKPNIRWHYWLGGQFWVGWSYWRGSPSVVSFFREVCGLELPKDIEERAIAWQKVCESVNYIWPNKNFVMVCARPKKIELDEGGRLHSENGKAIEYPDGWGLYALHGVVFPENLYKKVVSGNMPFEEILAIEDIDQRTQAMKFGDVDKFLDYVKAELLDKSEKGNELYKIPKGEIFTQDAYFLKYKCPSTGRVYMSGVPKEIGEQKSADKAMGWKFSLTLDEYLGIQYET